VDVIKAREVEEFEHVTVLRSGARTFYIVGTAHVSEESVDEVRRVIERVQPDTVCIELCPARYEALTDDARWKKLDIFRVIREGKTLFLLANLAVSAYQRRLGDRLGVRPGAELLAGAEAAEAQGAKLELVDRDVHVTLRRTWRSLSFWDKVKLLGAIGASLFEGGNDEVDAQAIERLKESDQLSEMMDELAKVMPAVKVPLIDERDQYLMSRIEEAPGERIVAVVGAGHVAGMVRWFGKPVDRAALEVVPPKSRWTSALKWLLPGLILAAFAWGSGQDSDGSLTDMLAAWILPNAIFCALLTAVALGKPLSILTGFVASPITSLNPLLGAGMVVGLVEAWLRRPTVADAERIHSDVQSIRGFYRNPFTRVMLVAVLANVGSAMGAWVGGAWVFSLLG